MEIVSMLENIEITIHFRDANEPKTILGHTEIRFLPRKTNVCHSAL